MENLLFISQIIQWIIVIILLYLIFNILKYIGNNKNNYSVKNHVKRLNINTIPSINSKSLTTPEEVKLPSNKLTLLVVANPSCSACSDVINILNQVNQERINKIVLTEEDDINKLKKYIAILADYKIPLISSKDLRGKIPGYPLIILLDTDSRIVDHSIGGNLHLINDMLIKYQDVENIV
ncbi:TlpA family protein disulfide reductase [Virgibacillus salexigens]|uniref:TlpA family protein disulfide reductase n=1 Tax=Virgibacillus massiliensis TaxID=1462526 RepID=UPI0013719DD3|nr:hypothetical protein [Virgibacillus massiliensis]MYL43940.1 hypothetical protein [Virgibacillus massiliensis]